MAWSKEAIDAAVAANKAKAKGKADKVLAAGEDKHYFPGGAQNHHWQSSDPRSQAAYAAGLGGLEVSQPHHQEMDKTSDTAHQHTDVGHLTDMERSSKPTGYGQGHVTDMERPVTVGTNAPRHFEQHETDMERPTFAKKRRR